MSIGSNIRNKKITVTVEIPENKQGKQTNDHIKSIIDFFHLVKQGKVPNRIA